MSDADDLLSTPFGLVRRGSLGIVRRQLAAYNRTLPDAMTEVDRSNFALPALENPPVRAWRSRRFVAALYREPGKPAARLSVCRAVLTDVGQFDDGISWDELQQVKRECGFGDREAVEVYPPDGAVVNVHNMRHLWILERPSGLAW